jgi:uncharacterized protein YhfF
MSFKDSMEKEILTAGQKRGSCSVRQWYEKQDNTTQKEWKQYMEDDSVPGTAIVKIMKRDYNFTGVSHTLQRHRRGLCKCEEL